MKKFLFIFAAILMMVGVGNRVVAQDQASHYINYTLPSMHIIDLEEADIPALTFIAPTNPGEAIAPVTDNDSWINITSIITSANHKKITVTRTGTIPTGTTLTVVAAAATADGSGVKGTPEEVVTLNTAGAQLFIDDIGSCWTDDGIGKGFKLTYTWSVSSYAAGLVAAASNSTVQVTYTISEVAD